MKLMVCYIMQESGKFKHVHVSAFLTSYMLSHFPDTVDMPPVVAGAFTFKTFFNLFCKAVYHHLIIHMIWRGWQESNLRHPAPKAGALPGCATPRFYGQGN